MTLTVIKGGSPLTADEKQKIQDIFEHSKCVNESLIGTFGELITYSYNDKILCLFGGEHAPVGGTTFTEYLDVIDNES